MLFCCRQMRATSAGRALLARVITRARLASSSPGQPHRGTGNANVQLQALWPLMHFMKIVRYDEVSILKESSAYLVVRTCGTACTPVPAGPRNAWSTAGGTAWLHVSKVTHLRRCLSMWKAICLTLLASSLNNIGKALQKEATGSLPRFSLSVGTVSQYLRSRTWLIGLAADVGGAVLMLAALALAPVSWQRGARVTAAAMSWSACYKQLSALLQVSLVQPVSGLGIVTLAVFSHFHLKASALAG